MTLRLVLPRVCCVRGRFLDRRFTWAATPIILRNCHFDVIESWMLAPEKGKKRQTKM